MTTRKLTLERTTTVERATIEETTHPGPAIPWVPGWAGVSPDWHQHASNPRFVAQRDTQAERCQALLTLWHRSAAADAEIPGRLIAEAALVLRAGPGASPMEAHLGRIA